MPIAYSKLAAQGQISVPAEIRKKLGIVPGSVLEWDEVGGKIIVKRSAKSTWEDVHKAAFPDGVPQRRTFKEMKEGIRQQMQEKYARG